MGRKDAQQLIIVTQFATEFFPKVEIVGCSTIREEDGLALSSRNAYLSGAERIVAPALFQGLDEVASAIEKRLDISEAIESARVAISEAGFVLDYLVCLDRVTFEQKILSSPGQYVTATAGKIGNTRLIDNFFVDIAADGQATVDRGIKRSRLSS
jgi:pantoate--beta-alanine ligase